MKKLKHSILSLLLLMGACIEFAFAGPVYSGRQENFDVLSSFQ